MIPATAHFLWYGKTLPFIYMVGIRSAAVRGGFERVVLHHGDDLSNTPHWDYLKATPGFEARPLRAEALPQMHGELGQKLLEVFQELEKPAAKTNLMRAAILAHEGGVYLDTDTITWRDITPLRERAAAFCGNERITLPATVKQSKNPLVHGRALAQGALRDFFRRIPNGWRSFRHIEPMFPLAANNAVLACQPGHPFATGLLERMVNLPAERRKIRFSLGTHLLQHRVADYSESDLEVHPPEVFFPLGPEISQHWFRQGTADSLDEILSPETAIIHWYASVRTKAIVPKLSPDTIRADRHNNALCRMASEFLDT